ncbi:MAG: hypothetical protein IPL61_09310 [Myxococcales bacterium]|nr:hypothetical protein [Myxococcales bacterium]
MRHRTWPLAALGLAALATTAAADQLRSDAREAALTLEGYQVTARLVDGTAHLRVRYDVVNGSRVADRARLQLELPTGAVVVGLRQRVAGGWVPGRLLAATVAQARYDAYLDTPFVAARGAAHLSGGGAFHDLAISFVPAHGRVGVEYEVVVPACYAGGHWLVSFPKLAPDPTVVAVGGARASVARAGALLGAPLAEACAAYWPQAPGADDHVLVWAAAEIVGATGVVTSLAVAGATVTAIDVAVAPTLAARPRRPAVVFVVDASRSQGDAGVARQLAIVRGYLHFQPDARVEVVVVRRQAVRLFGDLVPAAAALGRLATLPTASLAVGNGSHLDRGLALAATVLAAAPGPRRLIAFTDDRLRPGLTDDQLRAALTALPADAIAHVVLPGAGPAAIARDLEHHLVAAIAPWGGIVAAVGAAGDPAPLVELVRPVRIEQLAIGARALADELREGRGLRTIDVEGAAPVTGWIWGRRWAAIPSATLVARVRAARLALALGTAVDEPVEQALGALAGAVTRFASLVADRPGWTPGGLPDDGLGWRGGGSSSSMCGIPMNLSGYGTLGHGSGTGTGLGGPPDLAPLLAARVAGCAAGLEASPWRLELAVATTGVEVVDVTAAATGVDDATARGRFEVCAVEAGWDLDLDRSFAPFARTYPLSYAR